MPWLVAVCLIIFIVFYFFLPPRIVVCSFSDRPSFSQNSWNVLSKYCKKHGYDTVLRSSMPDTGRHQSWNKIILLKELSEKYDISVWIDDDIVITNPEVPLEYYLDIFEKSNAKIATQKDIDGGSEPVNCGFMFVKYGSGDLLQRIWDNGEGKECMTKSNWEQVSIAELMKTAPDDFFVYPSRTLHSFYNKNIPESDRWNDGDFAAHVVSGVEERPVKIQYLASGGRNPEN